MAEEQQTNSQKQKQPRKGGKKKLILSILVGIPVLLVAILVGIFLYVSSEAFIKGQVLPRVSKEAGGEFKVAGATIKPFSRMGFNGLSVRSTSRESLDPVLEVKDIDIRYDLMKLLSSGELLVSKVLVDSPKVHLKTYADKTTNYEFKAPQAEEETEEPDSSQDAASVLIENVEIRNASVLVETEMPDGTWTRQQVEGFNFKLDRLGNGQNGTISLSADRILNEAGADRLVAALKGQFELAMTEQLTPKSIKGSTDLSISETAGQMTELNDVSLQLGVDLAPEVLNDLSLRILRQGNALGTVRASGPFDTAKGSADLTLAAENINKSVLNLLAAGSGGDFGRTTFNLNSSWQASENWGRHHLTGSLTGSSVEWIADGAATPATDIDVKFETDVDTAASKAQVPQLSLFVRQGGADIVTGSINNPLTIDYGSTSPSISDAVVSLAVRGFNLSQWSSALNPEAPVAGLVNSTLSITSRSNGQDIALNMEGTINGFSNGDPASPLHNSTVNLSARGAVTGLKNIDLPNISLGVSRPGGPLLTSTGSLKFNEDGTIQLKDSIQLYDSKKPGDPEALDLDLTASVTPEVITIQNGDLTLKPTQKVASNRLSIKGSIPGAADPDTPRQLDITSPGLDVTRLKAFVDSLSPTKKETGSDPAPEPSPVPQTEPPPVELPFKYHTTNLTVDKLVLDKLTVDGVSGTLKINEGQVTLEPFQVNLLGAPLKANAFANLNVPGYEYRLSIDLADLPLSTLMSSMGQAVDAQKHGGDLDLQLGLNGKGLTDLSIKNNLRATTKVNLSDGSLPITGWFKRLIIMPIATVLRLDPILDGVVNRINVDAEFGRGALAVKELIVATDPFIISTQGNLPVADDIEQTAYQMPLTMSLRRDIAKSANFMPRNTPEDQQYVPLPDFIQLAGTFAGTPKVNLNEARIAQMMLQSAAGLPKEALSNATEVLTDPVGSASNVINKVGGLIPGVGRSGNSTNSSPRDPTKMLRGLFDRGEKKEQE